MTTPDRPTKSAVQWLIDNAKPDQLDRLLKDIERLGAPAQPTHFSTERLQ